MSLENLPDIDFILSSHNHYDHLDKSTVKYFINKNCLFIVPLKVKPLLVEWGSKNVVELDWWDSTSLRNVTIVSTPAQHFSNRSTNDRNKTLWATYLVDIDGKKIYFGGDTGYFSGFKDIGRRFGRIDLAMIPIGAYNDEMSGWRDIHLNPEDAVTAYKDLNAEYFIPIHWGTFQLAFHPIDEPVTRLKNRISDDKLDNEKFLILKIGETRILK